MPKYCYVYVLHSLADDQFYVGLTRDLPARLQAHNEGLVTSTKSECHSSLSIEKAVLTRVMRLGEKSTSRPRGENDTSKRGYEGIPRGKAETGRGSAERRDPSAALTKLFPSSHIGPGNLRHSDKTSSSALTNMSTSFSPMIRGGRIFITSIAWPATWVRMRCLLSIWVTTICAKSTLSILCKSFHAILSLNSLGS